MRRYGSDGCEPAGSFRRRVLDRVGLRAVFSFLSGLYGAGGILLLFWIRSGRFAWGPALALGGLLVLLTEVISSIFLKDRYPDPRLGDRSEFRMSPHLFAHFLPSRLYPDVSEQGFRITRSHSKIPAVSPSHAKPVLYLAGDCTFFENHLLPEETFAYQLSELLPGWEVLNAGVPHYTALHSYNRLVTDHVAGIRPDVILFTAAANDCLGFIHHKNGKFAFDHSHWCKTLSSYEELYRTITRWPTATLKLLLFGALCSSKKLAWSDLLEDFSPDYEKAESVCTARELFDPSGFVACLGLLRSTSSSMGARLVLTTFYYRKQDMLLKEPRRTYAWGIDLLNEEIRRFALHHEIPLIDWARELESQGVEVRNKWHYTPSANRTRAEITARFWKDLFIAEPDPTHALLKS